MQHNRPCFPALPRLGFRAFGSVLLLSLLMVFATVAPTHAAPPLPSSFYGNVQMSGADAPAGTRVSASIDGVTIAETMTRVEDGRAVYALDVLGDDPDTPGVEGGVDGKTIVFHVDGLAATQTAPWQRGELESYLPSDRTEAERIAEEQAPALGVSVEDVRTALERLAQNEEPSSEMERRLAWRITWPDLHF